MLALRSMQMSSFGRADLSIFYRKHIKPQFSQTLLLPNVYNNPGHTPEGQLMTPQQLQADFDRFYEDFFMYVELFTFTGTIPPADPLPTENCASTVTC